MSFVSPPLILCSKNIVSAPVFFEACFVHNIFSFLYFGGVFNKTIILLALVGFDHCISSISNERSWINWKMVF